MKNDSIWQANLEKIVDANYETWLMAGHPASVQTWANSCYALFTVFADCNNYLEIKLHPPVANIWVMEFKGVKRLNGQMSNFSINVYSPKFD